MLESASRIGVVGPPFWPPNCADPVEFTYSLASQDRDKTLDPIEDFLTAHRSGHCEYFATALVADGSAA